MERRIEFQFDIRAPAERVWKALTDPEMLPRWSYMDSVEVDEVDEGERVVQRWRVENASDDTAEILTSEVNRRLAYRWTSSEPEPTRVEYELEPLPDGIRLRFRNDGYLDGDAWDRYYGANLRGWVELHLALRDLAESAPA